MPKKRKREISRQPRARTFTIKCVLAPVAIAIAIAIAIALAVLFAVLFARRHQLRPIWEKTPRPSPNEAKVLPAPARDATMHVHVETAAFANPVATVAPTCAPLRLPSRADAIWNHPLLRKFNNCYSYAVNRPELGRKAKRYPGEHDGLPPTAQRSCEAYERRLHRDFPGQVVKVHWGDERAAGGAAAAHVCPCRPYPQAVIAMATSGESTEQTSEDDDFHFLRLDAPAAAGGKRTWSHKPGSKRVSGVDAANRPIGSPAEADLNYAVSAVNASEAANDASEASDTSSAATAGYHYDRLCGIYCVPSGGAWRTPGKKTRAGAARRPADS